MSISVVICAYTLERWRELTAAVESVLRQSRSPDQIIVVVDHNPTLAARARAAFPDLVTLENREERGLSGARNTGVAAATGAVVAFLDDDAVAERDWLERLTEGYLDERVLGVGGKIVPRWLGKKPLWFPEEFNWVIGCTYRGAPTTDAPVRNLIGANMSVGRNVFGGVGGFRREMGRIGTLPAGCEETELCIRALQRWPETMWLYRPVATVSHTVTPRRASLAYFVSRCFAEGQSKALVSALVGSTQGLASERRYTSHTLPLGLVRNIRDAGLCRDPWAIARAAAIVAGLSITVIGYAVGSLRLWLATVGVAR